MQFAIPEYYLQLDAYVFEEQQKKGGRVASRSKENLGQKTTNAMIQIQNDCLLVRVCQKAYIEQHQGVQIVLSGYMIRSFQASFRDA